MADRTEQDRLHYTPAGGVVQKKGSYTDFMCDCQEVGDQRCKQVLADACRDLKTEPEQLVTAVVFALTWNLENSVVAVTGVPCDQWCAVTAEMSDASGEELASFFIQCDRVEYGFARLWQMAAELDKGQG